MQLGIFGAQLSWSFLYFLLMFLITKKKKKKNQTPMKQESFDIIYSSYMIFCEKIPLYYSCFF